MRTRLFLVAAALFAFGASLVASFHFDDYAIFTGSSPAGPPQLSQIWSLTQTRPLTYLTFWMNYQLGGGDPLGYHALNLLLHIGAVLLVYECFLWLIGGNAAWIAAGLFAIHPMQSEAVDYVWARAIVLAALFCFAALLAWIEDRPWVAVAWFVLALLSKEEAAAFPLVLFLLAPKHFKALVAMLLASAAAGARVIYATRVVAGAPAGFQAGITPWNYLLAQGVAILRYLRLLLVPYGFTVDPDVRVPPLWLGLLYWLLILLFAGVVWRYAGKRIATFVIAGLVLLLPSSSIFPAADLAADRRMYLPMFAFSAAVAILLARLRPELIAMFILAVLTVLTFERTQVWMTERALWTEAVERAPAKVRPKIQLARAVPAARALELLSKAREENPYDPALAAEIGKTLLNEGQPDAALNEFGRALALDPRDARSYNNRGVALQQLGQTDAARLDFRKALELDPALNEASENLRKLPPER
jgi:tetratricopeptide (TPR) repeat protein